MRSDQHHDENPSTPFSWRKRPAQRLGKRLLLRILAVSFIVSVVMVATQLLVEYRNQTNEVLGVFEDIETEKIATIVQTAWLMDNDLLSITLKGITSNNAIVYARINDTQGKLLVEHGNYRPPSKKFDKVYPLIKYETIKGQQFLLGELLVQANIQAVHERLKRQLAIIIFTQFVKTLLVSFAILYLFRFMVDSHIQAITQFIGRGLNKQGASTNLSLKRAFVQDELQDIVDTINNMKSSLERSIDRLKQEIEQRRVLEQQAKSNADYLSLIFDNMSDALVVIDAAGQIQQYNHSLLTLLKISDRNIILKKTRLAEFIVFKHNDAILDFNDSEILSVHEIEGHCQFQKSPDFPPLKVSIKASPLAQPSGKSETLLVLRNLFTEESLRIAKYKASHDHLTGAKNRYFLEKRLQKLLAPKTADNNDKPNENREFCLAVVDLDDFKTINDNYGHAQGDRVLVEFVNIVNQYISSQDLLARTGGDEFILLLHNNLADGQHKVTSILNAYHNLKLSELADSVKFSASIGITDVDLKQDTLSSLVERADEACYTAKRRNKGQVFAIRNPHLSMLL